MALVRPAAISHWSAMSHHGLTDQPPRLVFVLTTARDLPRLRGANAGLPREGYPAAGFRYRFVRIRPSRFFGIEESWVRDSRIRITDPERTLLDGLLSPRCCGGFAEVLHAFEVRAPKLDVDRIVGYALRLGAATAKRLGWILERHGVKARRLKPLLDAPIKGYRPLDPTGPRRGPCDARWRIQANLPGRVLP